MNADGLLPLASVSEEARQVALARYRVLQPHLEEDVPLTNAAEAAGVPLRTAQRWLARYRADGLVSLARQARSDQGRRRMPADLQALIEGLALRRPQPSIAGIHRQAATVAAAQGWQTPSYACVYDVVSSLDPAMVALAQEGAKSYGQAFDLILRREASEPNEIWQADHTELDIWVLDAPGGNPARPWLTVVEDDYSRAVPGWLVNLAAPSARQTALALRRAIWRKEEPDWHVCGIPGVLYVDHGSDFTSRHLEQVAAQLKMRLVFSAVGQPRGRGKVERFFGVLNQLLLSALPGVHARRIAAGGAGHDRRRTRVEAAQLRGRRVPPPRALRDRCRPPGALGSGRVPAPHAREPFRTSTCCCSPLPSPARCTPTASASKASATSTPPSPATWVSR